MQAHRYLEAHHIRVKVVSDNEYYRAGLEAALAQYGFDMDRQVPVSAWVRGASRRVIIIDEARLWAFSSETDACPQVRLVVVTAGHDEPRLFSGRFSGQIRGYISDTAPIELIALAICAAHRDIWTLTNEFVAKLAAQIPPEYPEWFTSMDVSLSESLCRGDTLDKTAAALGISARTVSRRLVEIQRRLGLNGRAELVSFLARAGAPRQRPV